MDTVFYETPRHIEEIRNPRATSTGRSLIDVRNSAVLIGLPGLASAAQACHRKAAALAANPDQAAAALPAMAASLSRELRRAEAEWVAARPAFVRPDAALKGPGMPCGPEPAAGLGVAFKPHGAVAVRR
jgi:hypothetical protein